MCGGQDTRHEALHASARPKFFALRPAVSLGAVLPRPLAPTRSTEPQPGPDPSFLAVCSRRHLKAGLSFTAKVLRENFKLGGIKLIVSYTRSFFPRASPPHPAGLA
jgi:hypothetical protein